ncbi:MAG: hypothetical protein IBX50_13880 [Marinospirillum sp.]|uniref:hypothetical protein n=1 Tax=Marinospirillum sp. TaxID=2183934 RepID=UPI0019FFA68D|nr:hypothetical protein [Marinospirillum sp.]MBE0507776.1 hypothetical protein [Marinospirillum sp.]
MSLEPYVRNGQLHLEDQTLTLSLNLHQGLQLMAELDQHLDNSELRTEKIIEAFHHKLLESLLLLAPRERQALLQEASLAATACLLRMFRGKKMEDLLRANLSQRRISQVEEEPLYLGRSLTPAEELSQVLAPFHCKMEEQIKAGRIELQDPQGIYY